MYAIVKDKQPILDHVKLHKMHHYNNKFEEKKREMLENIPQIMTSLSSFDDETIYFSKMGLSIDSKDLESEVHKSVSYYLKINHPNHFVN